MSKNRPFSYHKKKAIEIAKDLRYGKETIKEIRSAATCEQINRVLLEARLNM